MDVPSSDEEGRTDPTQQSGDIQKNQSYLDKISILGLNTKDLITEALPPAYDPGDALPVIGRRGGSESNANAFRLAGFGKYRKDQKKRDQEEDDSDGIFHEGIDGNGIDTKCKHRMVVDGQCEYCPYKITKFGSFFDSGTIPQYLRILQASDSENSIQSLGKEVDTIYENYNPTNIIQLRDHMQTMIGRSLVSNIKKKDAGEHCYRVLPAEALYSDALEHVKNYERYRKDFKEQKACVLNSNALFIDSYFESGNIEKVYKNRNTTSQEYHLFIDEDTNTRGHQQWFYFRVRNMSKDIKYKFNIWNFTKPKSLYNDGMKPMWRSKKKEKYLNIEDEFDTWECIPNENISDIKYFRSKMQRQPEHKGLFDKLFEEDAKKETKQFVKKFKDISYYYCLTFTLQFTYNKDSVYIAYSRPFKYTRLITEILKLENNLMGLDRDKYSDEVRNDSAFWDGKQDIHVRDISYSRKLLCLTNSGLPVPILTITAGKYSGKPIKKREGIVISSRVHPGETNSSFVFQGMLEMLLAHGDPMAQYLRENFVFKLFPCLNPDGVVVGNYRSSFAGVDLNRQWILPSETLHPTIFHCKKELEKLHKERSVLLYCDLHGHSRKKNSFIYGCNRAANGGFNSWTKVRLLPRILARNSHVFDINSCKFKVEKSKMGTARVVIWKDFEVTNSFTLENSFYGYDYGESFKEFSVIDFKKLGTDLLVSVHQYEKILVEIQKELNITRGWLKPKRLLEITGQTAQEKLREEDKQRKIRGKARSQAIVDTDEVVVQPKPVPKPPRAPIQSIVKSRGGPSITLQGLIDEFVKKQEKGKEEKKVIPSKKPSQKSLTLSSSNYNKSAEKQKEESKVPSSHEKFVSDSIVKIQSFFRMMNQRIQYIEQLEKKAEADFEKEKYLVEDDSPQLKPKPGLDLLSIPKPQDNRMQNKYLSQLTLAVIESESKVAQLHPATTIQVSRNVNTLLESTEEEIESACETNTFEREREDDYIQVTQQDDGGPKEDWRQYFTVEELNTAYEKIQKGEDPNEDEVQEEEGSDSAPSEGNLNLQELYGVIYCDGKKKNEMLKAKDEAEQNYKQEFTNFIKKMHKKKRGVSKDSNGSAADTSARGKSKDPNKKIFRLGSIERKDETKVGVSGKNIDLDDEKTSKVSSKRKGRLIIGASKKASKAASSPDGAKNARLGTMPTIVTSNANLNHRRLRSQESGINGPALKTSETIKPTLSNANVLKLKAEQVKRVSVQEKTNKIIGISNSQQKRSFLPILANKLSSGVATSEIEPPSELRSELQISDTISPQRVTDSNINPSMQNTLNSAQFSGYDSFNGSKGMNPQMAQTTKGKTSMMKLDIPRHGINDKNQSMSHLAANENQQKQIHSSQQNINLNFGPPGQQANQHNDRYRLHANDQLNANVEPKGVRTSQYRSPQHQTQKRSPFYGAQEYQTNPAKLHSFSIQNQSPVPSQQNFGFTTGSLLNQQKQQQLILQGVDSRAMIGAAANAGIKSENPPRRNILRAQQGFGLQQLIPQQIPSIVAGTQISRDNQGESQSVQNMMALLRSPGQLKISGTSAAKKVNYRSPIGKDSQKYSDAIAQDEMNRLITKDDDDFDNQRSIHLTNENKQIIRSPINGAVLSIGQISLASKVVPQAHISISNLQNPGMNMHSPTRVVNGNLVRGTNCISPNSQLKGATRYIQSSTKKLGPAQGMPAIRLNKNQISPNPNYQN